MADKSEPIEGKLAAAAAEAVRAGNVIVCSTKCWACNFGDHFTPPRWHTWADQDDIDHARDTGQPDPSASRCGCYCAQALAADTAGEGQ